jgi:hypothetical protein
VKEVPTHYILIGRMSLKRSRVLTEEEPDDISRRFKNSPRKSLWRLALQSGVSVGNAWTANELSHIRQYKITILPVIKLVDYKKKVRFRNWFICHALDGLLDS